MSLREKILVVSVAFMSLLFIVILGSTLAEITNDETPTNSCVLAISTAEDLDDANQRFVEATAAGYNSIINREGGVIAQVKANDAAKIAGEVRRLRTEFERAADDCEAQ